MDLAPATEFLVKECGATLVILFGSWASRRAIPGSDVDLAFLPVSAVGPERRAELSQRLALSLCAEVDLVDLSETDGTLLREVLVRGEVLHRTDPDSHGALVARM